METAIRGGGAEAEVVEVQSRCTCDYDDAGGPACRVHCPDWVRERLDRLAQGAPCLAVPPRSFLAARGKLERAARNALQMQRAMSEYLFYQPYRLATVDNGTETLVRLHVLDAPRDEISEHASTAIHNLRACLDSIAWEVSRKRGSRLKERDITFPVKRSRAALVDARQTLLDTGGQDWLDYVMRVGPCPEGNDLLYALNELDIVDKHRDLIVVGASPHMIRATAPAGDTVDIGKGTGLLMNGDVVARCRSGVVPHVEMSMRLIFQDAERFCADDVTEALGTLHAEVSKVLAEAERIFP